MMVDEERALNIREPPTHAYMAIKRRSVTKQVFILHIRKKPRLSTRLSNDGR